MGGKGSLTPDLPLAQRFQIVRLVLPGKMPPDRGTEIGVQQPSRTTFIIFAQTFLPGRTALAVSAVCPILPVHTAGAAVQPLHLKLFPIGAMVNIFLLIIRKGIPFEFHLGPIGKRLRPDIKRDSLLLQHTMSQRKIISLSMSFAVRKITAVSGDRSFISRQKSKPFPSGRLTSRTIKS